MFVKFGEIKIDKKEFHITKKWIDFDLTDKSKIVVSDKFELEEGEQYYIGYKDGEFLRPLCIILTQISRFLKYFYGNRKNVLFLGENEEVIIRYNTKFEKKSNEICGFNLDSQPVYDKNYIKTKLKTYDDKVNTVFQTMKFQKKKLIALALQEFLLILY